MIDELMEIVGCALIIPTWRIYDGRDRTLAIVEADTPKEAQNVWMDLVDDIPSGEFYIERAYD